MLQDWMTQPHWQEWWGEPQTEIAYVRDMIEGRDSTRPFLFTLNGEDAGYIQVWKIADNRVEPWLDMAPWLPLLPDNAVGVDLSLARPDDLGKGLGSAVLAEFVALLRRNGETEIWIDPDAANARAIRAYEKAGFRVAPALLGRSGDCLLMRYGGEVFQDGRQSPI